ncbi:MAG: hypothetical protein E7253_06840 [Lachnospiraceae bacterium]|nr:hypothetical protein [Lachnospiraceae bacterium]
MNKRFSRDGFEYYLEIEAEGGEEYEYQMLSVSRIDTLLPVNIMKVNEKKQLIYSASGYKTLDSCLEKMVINGEQILHVMECVLKGVDDVRYYLLAPNNLVLSPDCLFVEPDYSRTGLIYVPGYNRDIILQLRELMESLLARIDSSDMQSVMLAWKLHTLIKDDHISLKEIRKIMSGYKEKGRIEGQVSNREESLENREYKEVKSFSAHKKKKQPSFRPVSLPLLAGGGVTAVLAVLLMIVLGMIYTGGILPWKRNLLLFVIILLMISGGITAALWKKDKRIHILRSLREK